MFVFYNACGRQEFRFCRQTDVAVGKAPIFITLQAGPVPAL